MCVQCGPPANNNNKLCKRLQLHVEIQMFSQRIKININLYDSRTAILLAFCYLMQKLIKNV